MNYEDTRAYIEERGKKWNDFIVFIQEKPYEIDPQNHYIIYPKSLVYKFVNQK